MVKFKFDKDILLVMQEGDTEEYPSEWIPIRLLGDLDVFGNNTSFWINHLNDFSDVPNSSLYFLAKIIQDKCPDNKIDWFKTFYNIEFYRLVAKREKEILAKKPSQRMFGARDYREIVSTWSIALEEIRATVSTGEIVAIVETNAVKYNVSLL